MQTIFAAPERIAYKSGSTDLELTSVVKPSSGSVFIEFPEGEPMENVLAAIQLMESGASGLWRVVFDPDDEDMWEVLVGGYRLHGMFLRDIV